MTKKQGGFMWGMTGRKFWEPDNPPPPEISEASEIIDLLVSYLKAGDAGAGTKAVELIRRWFPEFNISEIHYRRKTREPKQEEDRERLAQRKREKAQARPKAKRGRRKPRQEEEQRIRDLQEKVQAAKDARQRELMEKIRRHREENDKRNRELRQAHEEKIKREAEEREQEKQAEEQFAKAKEEKQEERPKNLTEEIVRMFKAGIRNFWLAGPAGCGKTTIALAVAEALEAPATVLSCNSGTSPSDIIGFKFPNPHHSPISKAFEQEGVVVVDDATFMDETAAGALQAVLANGEFTGPAGHVVRDKDCMIIATSNTVGEGADRIYSANSKWDGATMDRFAGAILKVDYSAEWEEKNVDAEVLVFVRALRTKIKTHGLRRIASTRMGISATLLKKAGMNDWRTRLLEGWSDADRRTVGC